MTVGIIYPAKDPDDTDYRVMVWSSQDATNDGSASDSGELQGATISSHTAVAQGASITVDSSNLSSIGWRGVTYAINTAVTVWVSGGTAGTNGEVLVEIVTSDSRTLQKTMTIPIRED